MNEVKCPKCDAVKGVLLAADEGHVLSCANCERLAVEADDTKQRNARKDKIDEQTLAEALRSPTKVALDLGLKVAGVGVAAAALFKTSDKPQSSGTDREKTEPSMTRSNDARATFWRTHTASTSRVTQIIHSQPITFTDPSGMRFIFDEMGPPFDFEYKIQTLKEKHPRMYRTGLKASAPYLSTHEVIAGEYARAFLGSQNIQTRMLLTSEIHRDLMSIRRHV